MADKQYLTLIFVTGLTIDKVTLIKKFNRLGIYTGLRLHASSKESYPLGDCCRIGARIGARISHRQLILVPILTAIPVGMTLQLGNWLNIAGQSESRGRLDDTSDFHCLLFQSMANSCLPFLNCLVGMVLKGCHISLAFIFKARPSQANTQDRNGSTTLYWPTL